MENKVKEPKRFTDAVSKLYNAFHENRLDAWKCEACAVGNLLGHGRWFRNAAKRGSEINPSSFGNISGYSGVELGIVEKKFLKAHDLFLSKKDMQFKGLCAVIEYLCELDNIPNPMDYSALFETENDKPKRELQSVFA